MGEGLMLSIPGKACYAEGLLYDTGFVNHYFPVESHKLYLSRPGFVNVQTWKNIIKKLNVTIMFPFYDLFKVHRLRIFAIL
jgi:hypothetical protein